MGRNGAVEDDDPAALRFRTQTGALSEDNLRWTARARFGTYKFFGFVYTDAEGFAELTPAGRRFIESPRPGEVLLRQLLKWQYPDNQHRGRRWPAGEFAIHPFVATARLIRELEGLTRTEVALFCFTMRRTEDAAATAEAIRLFRDRLARSAGRTGKAKAAHGVATAARARYEAEGRRVVLGSTDDYADALIRYFRYTGLFSVRGARIVVAGGREDELEELIYTSSVRPHPPTAAPAPVAPPHPPAPSPTPGRRGVSRPPTTVPPLPLWERGLGGEGDAGSSHAAIIRPIQLALGEAPPVRLAAPQPLFPAYEDAIAFYRYYGDADEPCLPWQEPARLAAIARALDEQLADVRSRELQLRTGRTALGGPQLGAALPDDVDALLELVDGLRRKKRELETAIYAAESRTPQRLKEALDFFAAIVAREVIDPPTFLEWNVWRVFLALDQAREIVPHLALDDDLQPLNPAQGNQPDLEIDYGDFVVVAEATLRTGADQRQAEARPVTRHILDAQRRYGGYGGRQGSTERPVYGLFLAPRIHPDTATDFFVALKYQVIERRTIVAIPLSLRQLIAALRPFTGTPAAPAARVFTPARLRELLDAWVEAAHAAHTGDEWLAGIDAALRRWLVAIGASTSDVERTPTAIPLPLFPDT
ncbi:MAG: AlwI family type II restriction endonuclease [Chloroflexi bacterium]|nr:AlwI family type II restriction endonuclease [Chloroflexota bacterium]